ncbi:glycosyltransferase family 4 protein [Pseudokineococcus lusitanus]|uniref:Glycosyltransferase involved in cell wall biosynthesis n=1 Tax=Pseudokineococcus lusitanus TaxID=763993 RepID=A0A3N1HJV6_9ACTN|nr:glycosyltransferase family 4 protein [Pseudokineococcus lusitanus]ROP42780.1 glycosyltransferase involved in cell wall biosynthesis [Pseudokineococcus lusitanus]
MTAGAPPPRRLRLVVPAPWDAVSGGSAYDRALVVALRARRADVEVAVVDGAWPAPDGAARDALAAALADDGREVVLDGLLAAAPEAVARAVAAGVRVHVLVHLPLAREGGLDAATAVARDAVERVTLAAATSVLATSAWAAADLRARHGLAHVGVAVPGVDPAPRSPGSAATGAPLLLQLAAVGPRKDQLGVVAALARLADRPWTAVLAGPVADARYAAAVDAAVAGAGLAGQVSRPGAVRGRDLARLWSAADLLLLPSRAETWGMAVTEALVRGVPAVVGAGTGAVEALLGDLPPRAGRDDVPGAVVPPGDVDALAAAVRRLLGDSGAPARRAAARRRAALLARGGWDATAAALLHHLEHREPRPEDIP